MQFAGNIILDKLKVLLMAVTCDPEINVFGTTIHTALSILAGSLGKKLPPLIDRMKHSLMNRLSDFKVIFIDEISVVSNGLLH